MKAPAVSVLMPVYNAERHLRQSIESILNQTFHDFEFLILDDGSTDSSFEIAGSYNDPRIRIIRNEENLGISATLNKGIEECASSLIARMDADDVCLPTRLQKQYDYMVAHPECGLLSASIQLIGEDGKLMWEERSRAEFFYYNLTFTCWIYHPTVMYRRDVVRGAGMYAEEYSEDFDLWWHISRKYIIHHLEEILLSYRKSVTSLSAVTKLNEYEEAQHRQVVRNIRYFAGAEYQINFEEVEALRCNFIPLINLNSSLQIKNFFSKLQHISRCVAATPNINCNSNDVMAAFDEKKMLALGDLRTSMRTANFVAALLRMGRFKDSAILMTKGVFRYIFRMSNKLVAPGNAGKKHHTFQSWSD